MIPRRDDRSIDLGGEWSFALSDRRLAEDPATADDLRAAGLTVYPATVPGNLELDLLANGLIDEPFHGMNIVDLRRYERTWAYYVRSFEAAEMPGTTPHLVFEGVDCFADIFLNGQLVHRCDNMLIEQVASVAGSLRSGEPNDLCVVIEPALERARAAGHPYPPGLNAEGSGYEGMYARKAPHMYGWDIMPRAVSAGLWRPVSLRYRPDERIDWAWLDTEGLSADRHEARLALHYRMTTVGDPGRYELRVSGSAGASVFERCERLLFDAGCLRFACADPRLWWPRGRGEQNLYSVKVELLEDGRRVDELTLIHGIRTVELDRTSVTTETGDGEFCFRINGERTFLLGTNWVPLDAYHSRDIDRIPAVLDLVEEIGCNAIRCWGGNVYEHDTFFELCDQKGILVWQDFAMACAIYPQDADFQDRLRAEATQVVRRLRQHPSLVLWAGDNECDQKYLWGGRRRNPNTNVLTREVIPAVLRDEDPSRPYLPSSPYVDEVAFVAGERYLPEDHLWGPRDYYKSPFYTSALCHFASEIGYHGCPEPATLRRFLSPDRVWPPTDNEEWLLHSTSPLPGVDVHAYRVQLMVDQVTMLFGAVPDTVEDFASASQASQAEALKFFIEMFRVGKWRRTGIIWWNIADGWPQFSDAIVDYYLAKKQAFEVVRRSQAQLCVVVGEPSSGFHEIAACNDHREDLELTFAVRDVETGQIAAEGRGRATGDAVTTVGRIPATPGEQRTYLIEWTSAQGSGVNHYLAGEPPFSLARYRQWMELVGLGGTR
ncbi:MAG: beta-mannosidase [Chloroflexota bacterium]|nr:beta-mannosidase [Chloroflexota bacterium]